MVRLLPEKVSLSARKLVIEQDYYGFNFEQGSSSDRFVCNSLKVSIIISLDWLL